MLRPAATAAFLFLAHAALAAGPPAPTRTPIVRVVDLDVGEAQNVLLSSGRAATVKLNRLTELRDEINHSVRRAEVDLEVNGKPVTLVSATYHLPVEVGGVQVDCPITSGYNANTTVDHWGLVKAARVRLWPAGSPWVEPGTMAYPVKQRWFASLTQMANEPVYVDGGDRPGNHKIYYHSGLDIGGAEGLTPIVVATNGLCVSSGTSVLPGYEDTPVAPRYDVVYILDDQGWYYRYSHMQSIDPGMKPGARVKQGQPLGTLGKEGGSGGWSHLHFEVVSRQPSGKWGTQEGYAFLWQAYQEEYRPDMIAVARPHAVAAVGQFATPPTDGSGSWARLGRLKGPEWLTLPRKGHGDARAGAANRPTVGSGRSEPLPLSGGPRVQCQPMRVSDEQGHVAYDFSVIHVLDPRHPDRLPPTIHAAFYPTMNIRPADPVTFKVRTFRTTEGEEIWDFGDSTEEVRTRSDGNVRPLAKNGYAETVHRFALPGDYLVHVERSNERKETAETYLHVHVDAKD